MVVYPQKTFGTLVAVMVCAFAVIGSANEKAVRIAVKVAIVFFFHLVTPNDTDKMAYKTSLLLFDKDRK